MMRIQVVVVLLMSSLAAYSQTVLPICRESTIRHACSDYVKQENVSTYVGDFLFEKFHGLGEFTNSKGYRYRGEWKNGLPDGWGTTQFAGAGTYVGDHSSGKRRGWGTLTTPQGVVQSGEWGDSGLDGQGYVVESPEKSHVGEYRAGVANGLGVMSVPNGSVIIGYFVNGKIQGEAIEYSKGSMLRQGQWESGQLVQSRKVSIPTAEALLDIYSKREKQALERSKRESQDRDRQLAEIALRVQHEQNSIRLARENNDRQRLIAELELERSRRQALESQASIRERSTGPSLDDILKLQQIVGNTFGSSRRGTSTSTARENASCTVNGWLIECSRGKQQLSCTRNGSLIQCSDGSSCQMNGSLVTCN